MDEITDLPHKIKSAAASLARSQYAIAFTGAGISTPSGIPDFRSPGVGLWAHGEPPRAGTIQGFAADPEGFYEWFHPLLKRILSAEPNPGHRGLATLEAEGILKALITQNADLLHQRAGSRSVIEVHGTLAHLTCIRCYCIAPGPPILKRFLRDREVPRCQSCGGVMKPNVILAGEQLVSGVMTEARRLAQECDVILVAGTSLPGGPASELPEIAVEKGARLIIINRTPTPLDQEAEVIIHGDVAEVFPAIVNELQRSA